MMKRIISFLLVITIVFLCSSCGKTENEKAGEEYKDSIIIVDRDGNAIAEYKDGFSVADMAFSAYSTIALNEAVDVIKAEKKLSDEKALDFLKNKYVLTAFDSDFSKRALESAKDFTKENFGFTVTDLNGGIIAAGSSDTDENYATKKTFAGSTIKPLSVYAIGLEKGIMNWSSVKVDKPYKKLDDGQDWPQNADGQYTNGNITVCDAVKKSVNTLAVSWLKELGVSYSIDFLTDNFGMDFSFEREEIKKTNEDEVLGNVALGYLRAGVSTVDMAGYYQIFANGGAYYKPYTVYRIVTADGDTVYSHSENKKQVIKPETAEIMNKLLQCVVNSGTGVNANIKRAKIGGKTGTTDNNDDNWFVGFSPDYCCACWHGNSKTGSNTAPEIFKLIMEPEVSDKKSDYPKTGKINSDIYCGQSGMLLSENCTAAEEGYYVANHLPATCTQCK